jgi:F-type H+-transporting ATPase subunit gamma
MKDTGATTDYLFEETPEHFLIEGAKLLVESRIYEAVVESAVAEHAARMTAMDSASSNCDRLISKYIQLRNRARQAVITTELNEIVTGKEALES